MKTLMTILNRCFRADLRCCCGGETRENLTEVVAFSLVSGRDGSVSGSVLTADGPEGGCLGLGSRRRESGRVEGDFARRRRGRWRFG